MQRKITPAVGRAETALCKLERDWEASRITHNARWAEKRLRFIRALPEEVQRALVRLEVLDVG